MSPKKRPEAPKKKVTLNDVATLAGVSLSTASKALSGSDRVSPETRARVREIANRLDFRPNALAQSFARGRSRTIGILTQNAIGTWSAPILVGATTALGGEEHAVLVYDARFDGETIAASVRRLQDRRVDGVIIIGDGPQYRFHSVTHEFSVPVAYVFTTSDAEDDVAFLPDGRGVGRAAVEHLLAIGRTRIAHLTVAEDVAARTRRAGMVDALAAQGLAPVADLEGRDWSEDEGVEMAGRLLASRVPFDAIFCGNDHIARGAERVLTAHGLRVPDDVALVGVDNWEGVIVGQGQHHLTTVDTLLTELGATAARWVTDAGTGLRGVQPQPVRLVLGASTMGHAYEREAAPGA